MDNLPIHLFKPRLQVESILSDLREIFENGWFGLGPKTQEFEERFADYVGAKYAVGVNSCTAALHLALIVSGVKRSSVVATTPLSFVSTNHAILYQGARPLFIDVDESSLCLDPYKLGRKQFNAIILVHYAGNSANIEPIYKIARRLNIPVIEDCAHAAGAKYKDGRMIGSCPYEKSISCFSFHAVKNLPVGDGGMITTNDKAIADRLRRLRWLGIDKDTFSRTEANRSNGYKWLYNVDELGYKCHMNDISAVIGLHQLKCLDRDNEFRRSNYKRYKERLFCIRILESDVEHSSHHLVVGIVPNRRDELVAYLNRNNVFPGVHYFPNHLYDIYRQYYASLPVTESIWSRLISLPNHLYLSDEDIDRVCNLINSFYDITL